MKDNVHQLSPHTRMTVEEALSYAGREKWNDVMIIGYDQRGVFALTSSHLKRSEAIYLTKLAEMHIMRIE